MSGVMACSQRTGVVNDCTEAVLYYSLFVLFQFLDLQFLVKSYFPCIIYRTSAKRNISIDLEDQYTRKFTEEFLA